MVWPVASETANCSSSYTLYSIIMIWPQLYHAPLMSLFKVFTFLQVKYQILITMVLITRLQCLLLHFSSGWNLSPSISSNCRFATLILLKNYTSTMSNSCTINFLNNFHSITSIESISFISYSREAILI